MFLWNIAVTSLAEVWIEIVYSSLGGGKKNVTSLAEVWIEMLVALTDDRITYRHFPCGSVD